MKKNLFYAAFALAMMASCTNEDNLVVDPANPTPDAEDKVAITLGIDAPSVNATLNPRSTGSVGDIADPEGTTAENKKNKWNGQRLYIAMFEKGTTNIAKVDGSDVLTFTNHYYYAPKGSENTESGDIRFYNEQFTNDNGNADGTLQYEYYPVSGQYDFYGYHVDDAGGSTSTEAPLKVTGIKIKGWQDIMGARTKEFTEANYGSSANPNFTGNWADMNGWDFSARTARNKIKPILKFEHQLARLKFFVRAGSDKTALMVKGTGDNWEKRDNVTGQQVTDAMYLTSLKVNDLIQNLTMDLNATVDGKKCIQTTPTDETTDDFVLGQYDAQTNSIVTLQPVAPKYPISLKNAEAAPGFSGNKVYEETPVGESIMFFPYGDSKTQLTLDLELTQWVINTEDETKEEDDDSRYTWTQKTQPVTVTVKAENVRLNNVPQTAFEATKSYNVYITVYGFERIEVTAELTPWDEGGDVNVDIENDATNNGANSGTQTPITKNITVNVTDGTSPIEADKIEIIEKGNDQATAVEAVDGKYPLEVGKTYTVTVTESGYTQADNTEITVSEQTSETLIVTMTAVQQPEEKVQLTFIINDIPADPNTTASISINGDDTQYNHNEGAGTAIEVEKGSVSYTITTSDDKTYTKTIEVTNNYTVTVSYNDFQ